VTKLPSDLGKRREGVIGPCYYKAGPGLGLSSLCWEREVEELRWFGQVKSAQDVVLAGGGRRALGDAAVGEGDQVHAVEFVPQVLPGAQDPHLGGVHDAVEEPGILGVVVGKVPVHVGEVPDSRQIFGGDCCLRAGAGRERRGRLSRPGPWSAAGRGSPR